MISGIVIAATTSPTELAAVAQGYNDCYYIIICFCKEEEWTRDHESYSNDKACGDTEVGLDHELVFNRKYVHKNQQSPDKKEYKVSLRCKDLEAQLITDAEYAQNEKHNVK